MASPILVLAAIPLLLMVLTAMAQSGDYNLSWWTVDGGGHTFSTGGDYTLGGTIGQPDAEEMSDGGYTLSGGFWGSVVEYLYRVLLPLILKNYTP